jgi:cysteine desulfurase
VKPIYLDYNAGAPVHPLVRDAMARATERPLGNPSSVHAAGRAARVLLEEARAAVAHLIGATPAEVLFVSGGTEANNLALGGMLGGTPARHLVTTTIEHASVLEPCAVLRAAGHAITYVAVDRAGRVAPGAVEDALRPETALVSVGMANGEVGVLQPIAEIGRRMRRRGVPFHVDAVQAAGRIPVAVDEIGADLLSLSAHKLGGPQGIGALYVRTGTELRRQIAGGPQERELRGGTENTIGALGFGVAARLARERIDTEAKRQAELVRSLWERIREIVPDASRNGPAAWDETAPNTLNVSFPGVDADALVIGFDLAGIAVSAGSACAAGSLEPSHVLLAMGRSAEEARAGLRISVGSATTRDELEAFLEALPAVVHHSRGESRSEATA